MSWKSRRRRKFLRLISRLENTSITRVGPYVFIDEGSPHISSLIKRVRSHQNMLRECEQEIKLGRIKSPSDFDNYYSPYFDLTIEVNQFEKNESKVNKIVHDYLSQIAEAWRERVKSLFGCDYYIIEVLFRDEDNGWFLNCYHA